MLIGGAGNSRQPCQDADRIEFRPITTRSSIMYRASRVGGVLFRRIVCSASHSKDPSRAEVQAKSPRTFPSTLASLSAVSGVTPRLPLIISLRRGNETPSLTAKSDCVMPIGFKNSSSSISPGCVGARFLGSLVFIVLPAGIRNAERPLDLVVVDNFDLICSPILPTEADTIPLVDSDTHLTFPVVLQLLQHVSGWNGKISQVSRPVDLVKLSLSDRPQIAWTPFPGGRRLDSIE